MKTVSKEDLDALQMGIPPLSDELIDYLTVPNDWLDLMKTYCLEQVIAAGGSKVKILFGGAATGKSHYLQNIKVYAKHNGFFVVDMNLAKLSFPLTDSVSFYKAVAQEMDIEQLEETLKAKILENLGHDVRSFNEFGGVLTDYLCEKENAKPDEAKRYIRECIHKIVNALDLEFTFRKFLHMMMEAVVDNDTAFISTGRLWFKGEKIERPLKTQSHLYETLNKSNARSWLYSLIEVIKFMGYRGVVILLDQFEAVLPKRGFMVNYTPTKRNDVYELLRQLIDDLDFFRNILILIAGDTDILEDEPHGLQSYQALWLRIQTGFKQQQHLNLYTDMIDADLIFKGVRERGELEQIKDKLAQLGVDSRPESDPIHIDKTWVNFRDLVQDRFGKPKQGDEHGNW